MSKVKRRRWFSISLRASLILLLGFSLWLAWIVPRAASQKKAVEWARTFGREPLYDFQFGKNRQVDVNSKPWAPSWVVNSIGIDYFGSVELIHLDDRPLGDISRLAALHHLRHCELSNCEISDLKPLERLTNIELLSISKNPISDLSPIANFKKLKRLSMYMTEIEDISVLENLTRIESIWLNEKAADISPLKDHPSIESLYLYSPHVKQIDTLQSIPNLKSIKIYGRVPENDLLNLEQALPDCEIVK